MALTYNEKVDKLKLDRSIAISAKDAVTTARTDALSEDQYNNFYLHGDSEYIGINDLIWYHLKERYETSGITYEQPSLGDSLGEWDDNWSTIITAALDEMGDGVWGLYPPDENGKAQDEVNYESYYLNLNGGDTIPNPKEGLIGYLQDAIDTSGDSGSGDSYHSGDSYASQELAEDAAKQKLYAADDPPGTNNDTALLGTALLGRRTCNINITTSAGTEPGYYLYAIGDDGTIDDDDFYANNTGDANGFLNLTAYKTNLTSSLSNIITYGDSVSAYQTALQGLEVDLRKIQGLDGDTNTFFRDTGMNLEIGDSAANVNTLLSTLSDKIGDSGDTWPGDTNFWAFYNYFNDSGVVVGDSYFNPGLRAIKSFGSSLRTTLNTRFGNLEKRGDSGILGDTYITGEGDFTKERKWRLFWLKSRVAKPKSSQFDYIGLGEAVTGATNQVTEWDSQLNILLGSDLADHLAFIKTPTLYATYYDPKTDKDDGHVIQRKVSMVYDGQQHATHYWIYREDVPAPGASSITNDQWSDGSYNATQSTVDDDSGFVKNTYTFYDTLGDSLGEDFISGKQYVHRIRTFDNVNTVDDDMTASEQSDIFDTTTAKNFGSMLGDSVIVFGDSHAFTAGSYVVINGTTSKNGYYYIEEIGDTTITIYPDMPGESSGTVYTTSSVIFMRE